MKTVMKMVQCGEKHSLSAPLSPPWWPPPQQSVGIVVGPQQGGRTGLGAAKDDAIRKCGVAELGGSSTIVVTCPWSC